MVAVIRHGVCHLFYGDAALKPVREIELDAFPHGVQGSDTPSQQQEKDSILPSSLCILNSAYSSAWTAYGCLNTAQCLPEAA